MVQVLKDEEGIDIDNFAPLTKAEMMAKLD